MKNLNYFKVLIFAVGFAFGVNLLVMHKTSAASATAAKQRITEEQSQRIIDLTVGAMKNVANARGNLKQKKYPEATKDLTIALNRTALIRLEEPTIRIKDRIKIAQKHLEYESMASVIADLIPIYSELPYVETFTATLAAKGHLDKAQESLRKDDRKTANEELRLAGELLSYSEFFLPISRAEEQITKSQDLIRQKKYDTADAGLKSAEQSLMVASNAISTFPVRVLNP